jgi:hypothetical protein
MTTMKRILLLILIAFAVMACKNQTTDKNKPAATTDQQTTTEVKAKGRYAIKSGIVEYKSMVMGLEASQTLFFDDFGALESTVTSMEMMGIRTVSVTINRDGFVYTFDPEKKTGKKTVAYYGSNVNFEDLTEEIIKDFNLKKEGKDVILGKECEKWSMDNTTLGMKGFYWVYKGVALKVDTDLGAAKMQMDATSFQENVEIPAGKLDIPSDIVFE